MLPHLKCVELSLPCKKYGSYIAFDASYFMLYHFICVNTDFHLTKANLVFLIWPLISISGFCLVIFYLHRVFILQLGSDVTWGNTNFHYIGFLFIYFQTPTCSLSVFTISNFLYVDLVQSLYRYWIRIILFFKLFFIWTEYEMTIWCEYPGKLEICFDCF